MVDAVLARRPRSPLDAQTRLQALKGFLALPDAAVLAAINKRIVNILRKAPAAGSAVVDASALHEEAERTLHAILAPVRAGVRQAIQEHRYADALDALTPLRAPVDAFFDQLLVMDENPRVRDNRLALLTEVQTLLCGVADLSRLPG
jgi:glycyl-tRNA synthetase beta chain